MIFNPPAEPESSLNKHIQIDFFSIRRESDFLLMSFCMHNEKLESSRDGVELSRREFINKRIMIEWRKNNCRGTQYQFTEREIKILNELSVKFSDPTI